MAEPASDLADRVERAMWSVESAHDMPRAAIRATLEAAIARVRPRGYRSEDHFPSGVWSGREWAADILRDMITALDG